MQRFSRKHVEASLKTFERINFLKDYSYFTRLSLGYTDRHSQSLFLLCILVQFRELLLPVEALGALCT